MFALIIFRGFVTLIVNVASFWGLTAKNYTQLVELHSTYAERGLRILGFPCNQFGKQVYTTCVFGAWKRHLFVDGQVWAKICFENEKENFVDGS